MRRRKGNVSRSRIETNPERQSQLWKRFHNWTLAALVTKPPPMYQKQAEERMKAGKADPVKKSAQGDRKPQTRALAGIAAKVSGFTVDAAAVGEKVVESFPPPMDVGKSRDKAAHFA